MALDESDFFRPVARFIAWIVVDFVYEIGFQLFCVWVGRIVLLTLTLGKYPDSSQAHRDEIWIGIFGLFFIFILAFLSIQFLGL